MALTAHKTAAMFLRSVHAQDDPTHGQPYPYRVLFRGRDEAQPQAQGLCAVAGRQEAA